MKIKQILTTTITSMMATAFIAISLPVQAQEAAKEAALPALDYDSLFTNERNILFLRPDGYLESWLIKLLVYSYGYPVAVNIDLVGDDGKSYIAYRKAFKPKEGTYHSVFDSTGNCGIPACYMVQADHIKLEPGKYWLVMSYNQKVAFADWFDVKKTDSGKSYAEFSVNKMARISFGKDGKGKMEVTLFMPKQKGEHKVDLALMYKGKRVGYLQFNEPQPAPDRTDVAPGTTVQRTYRMVYPVTDSNNKIRFTGEYMLQNMLDGDWKLNVTSEGKTLASYAFTVKKWVIEKQGRQKETTPLSNRIVSPYSWWLQDINTPVQTPPLPEKFRNK